MTIFQRRYRNGAADVLPTEPRKKAINPQMFEHQGQPTIELTQPQIEHRQQLIDQQQESFAAEPEARITRVLHATEDPDRQGVTTPIQDEIGSKLAAKDAGTLVDKSGEEQPSYLADWSKGFEKGLGWLWHDEAQQKKPTEVIQDYNRWAKDNGQEPLDAFTMYPFLMQYDPTKSLAESKKEERRLKSQEKWEQIGNVLSHVGNFIGTALGAPSQQLETGTQLTERQKKLRDAALAQRRQSAIDMLTQLNKDRADARAAELNAANIDYKNNAILMARNKDARDAELARLNGLYYEARAKGAEAQADKIAAEIERIKALLPLEEQEKKATIGQKNASATASLASADASRARAAKTRHDDHLEHGDDFDALYNDPEYRPYIDEWAKTNDLAVDGNRKGKGGNWSKKENRAKSVSYAKDRHRRDKSNKQANTPPSRRGNANSDNTPPSRRK